MKNKTLKITICCILCILTAVFFIRLGAYKYSEESQNTFQNRPVVSILPERMLIPGGHSIGVKMNVKGVLVVGLEEIEKKDGTRENPGLKAGLEIGDTILSVNGEKVENAAEVQNEINRSTKSVHLKIKRKSDILEFTVTPIMSANDNRYKIGVWVKEKTAGIGTLTFYDPVNRSFGALGHAITNPETGTVLKVAEGELVKSKVQSVKQGKAGEPGEIKGIFYEDDEPLGSLEKNTIYGVFGSISNDLKNALYSKPIPIGYQQDIKKGEAYILTTMEGSDIGKYSVNIEKINHQTKADTKGLVIKVTDERLLKKSGGIVQGMSGSPIVQNGKLVGAVTHVFVNDPQKGYGIFIEWMIDEMDVE